MTLNSWFDVSIKFDPSVECIKLQAITLLPPGTSKRDIDFKYEDVLEIRDYSCCLMLILLQLQINSEKKGTFVNAQFFHKGYYFRIVLKVGIS